MSDSNTTAIDEKKEETTGSSDGFKNIGKFFTSVLSLIFFVFIYFSISGLVLYGCKIGQANILPTDENCFPYTNLKPDIDNIPINIFTTFTDPQMSMKLNFPYNKYNSSNKILDLFRSYKEEPKSNFLANYFISIIESLLQFNYSSINFILNTMNGLPEMLVVLLGPIILPFALSFIFLFDHLYLIYLWFANMGWFFKHNSNSNLHHKPVWDYVTILEPIDYWCGIGLVILFFILFWVLLAALPVLPFITMSLCIFSGINYMSIMNNKNTTSLTIIKELFKYYKVTIMSILSFFIVVASFSNLGTIPGVFSIITLGLIYWGILSINIFKSVAEDGVTPLSSYDQAKKVCNYTEGNKEKHGLLYNLLIGSDSQKGGGNLLKKLKKISKELSK
jgi:hypothetical protein